MPASPSMPKPISGVVFQYNPTSKDWQNQALYNCSDADRDEIEGIFSYQSKAFETAPFLAYLWPTIVEDQIRVSWNFLRTLRDSGVTHAKVLKIALAALVSTGMLTDRQHNIWIIQYGNVNDTFEVPDEKVTLAFNKEKDALNYIHDVYPLSPKAAVTYRK